jgi:ribose/xylose/arabinose/galactoside ABC-type transport system permease subunit
MRRVAMAAITENRPRTTKAFGAGLRLQEGGLLLVIVLLGAVLTIFGGTVKEPRFRTNAQGERERVFVKTADGEEVPAFVERNKFLRPQSLTKLAKDTSFTAIMAVGMTFVIVAGQIDLSVGAIYALASVLGALTFHAFGPGGTHPNAPAWLSVPLGMAACVSGGTLCGLLNGAMTVALKVHPFIITLGTMSIFRGIAFVITTGQSVGGFPDAFRRLVRWEVGDNLSVVPLVVMVAVTVIGGTYLSRLAAGRRVYAVGGNELASRFSGIRVQRVKLSVFIFAGMTAGLAALVALGYYGSASSADGTGYELNVIAAAVVGGASLSGGKGSALGAFLGALVIQMISTGLVILEINQDYSQIVIGAVVILAVVFDQFNTWLAKRRLVARAGAA